MSATIPEHALLSDLLKPTGYDCPEALAGKTFAEATSGGDVEVETNKAATIDVSQYTEPVVITPTSGKDAMAKATVTLSNIPSAPTTMYCWVDDNEPPENRVYCVIPSPKVGDQVFWTDADSVLSISVIKAVTETTLTTVKGTVTRSPENDVVMVS